MSLWRQVVRGVRALSNRAAVDAELEDEVRDYFERARADLVRQGLTPDEAARVARRELGDLATARNALRSYGWENHVDAALGDFRQSWRRLRQNPSFCAVVVATLALGIGVNVALFSLFQQILLRPLPVRRARPARQSRRSGSRSRRQSAEGCQHRHDRPAAVDHVFSYPMFRDLEREQEPFVGLAAHRLFDASLSTGEHARPGHGLLRFGKLFLACSAFDRARPAARNPRTIASTDKPTSVVLSHAYWQRELGGDPDVLGRTLTVNGVPLTIVGVAPQGFHGTAVGARASVFVPITFHGRRHDRRAIPNHDGRGAYWVHLFARLEPGVDARRRRRPRSTRSIAGS